MGGEVEGGGEGGSKARLGDSCTSVCARMRRCEFNSNLASKITTYKDKVMLEQAIARGSSASAMLCRWRHSRQLVPSGSRSAERVHTS